MRIAQRIPTLLIIVYVCIGSKYAQRYKQTNNNCGLQRFRCRNGECIVRELLCDGKTDCRDSSDATEAECRKLENLCPIYTFRCNYGACIDRDSVCNGVQDCVDNSDETQPQCTSSAINTQTERPSRRCKMDEFTCSNGQCISNIDMCDGTRNCMDGSDEIFTLCRSLFCPPTAFRCTYGACIDGDLRCNGVVNCVDSSDEAYCSNEWLPSATIETTQPPPTPTPKRPSVTPVTNTCRAPPQPLNGRWKLHRSQCSDGQDCNIPEGTELGLGSHLVYSCDSGYKIRGAIDVSCSVEEKWLNIPVCTAILCKALATVSTRAECIYNKEWIPCNFPVLPKTRATLTCENSYRPETANLLPGQRMNVRCNANGQWKPEPMRCVPDPQTIIIYINDTKLTLQTTFDRNNASFIEILDDRVIIH